MKTAFVTGGNRGLGRGFVEYFLEEGFQVFAGVLKSAKMDPELTANPNLVVVELDVTDDESIRAAFEEVSKHTDHIDYLVNNAGVNKDTVTGGKKELVGELESLDRKLLLKMFDVNSVGPIMMTKEFLSLMKDTPSFVVNISSCRASLHDPYGSSNANYGYRASKAAVTMFTLASTEDLPENIKTFSVHPGNVHTDMNPKGNQEPKDQAAEIINITKNWNDDLNGQFLNYDGTLFPL